MKTRQSGFTLVELMVTIAVVMVLTVLAVPSFQSFLMGRRVEAGADTLVSDFRYARSEAVKRTNKVTICASSNGTACTGVGALWKSGWIVFVDENGNGAVDAGDVVLRVQEALPGIASIAAADNSSAPKFVFEATGWSQSATQTFWVKPTGSATVPRLVCVSIKGRAAIRPKGTAACQ
jgi:type IV fimbrial biogenesis protein FimT